MLAAKCVPTRYMHWENSTKKNQQTITAKNLATFVESNGIHDKTINESSASPKLFVFFLLQKKKKKKKKIKKKNKKKKKKKKK